MKPCLPEKEQRTSTQRRRRRESGCELYRGEGSGLGGAEPSRVESGRIRAAVAAGRPANARLGLRGRLETRRPDRHGDEVLNCVMTGLRRLVKGGAAEVSAAAGSIRPPGVSAGYGGPPVLNRRRKCRGCRLRQGRRRGGGGERYGMG